MSLQIGRILTDLPVEFQRHLEEINDITPAGKGETQLHRKIYLSDEVFPFPDHDFIVKAIGEEYREDILNIKTPLGELLKLKMADIAFSAGLVTLSQEHLELHNQEVLFYDFFLWVVGWEYDGPENPLHDTLFNKDNWRKI